MGAFVHMVLLPELLFYQGFSRFSACCYLMLPAVTSTRDGASQPRGISSGTYVFPRFLQVPPRKSTCAPAHDTRGRRDSAIPHCANCCFTKDFQGFWPAVTECHLLLPPALRELLFPRIFKVFAWFYLMLPDARICCLWSFLDNVFSSYMVWTYDMPRTQLKWGFRSKLPTKKLISM